MSQNSQVSLDMLPTLTHKAKDQRNASSQIKELRVNKEAALWLDNLTACWGQHHPLEKAA